MSIRYDLSENALAKIEIIKAAVAELHAVLANTIPASRWKNDAIKMLEGVEGSAIAGIIYEEPGACIERKSDVL